MRGSALWPCALAAVSLGCMVHERHVESVPGPMRAERSAPLAGSERVYVLIVPRMDLFELRVRAEASCAVRAVRSVRRMEVVTRRAAGERFIGAAAAVIGGTILLSGEGSDALGATLLGAAGVVVVVPLLEAGEERRELPTEEQPAAGGASVACGDRPVRDARVAVRIGAQTLEGRSDVAGRVRFRDAQPSADMIVYVDDLAVPTRVGAPPTGTLPASEDPARPGGPGSR